MKRTYPLLSTLLLSLIGLLPFTASSANQTVQIEVIIFQSLALSGWTEEYWPSDLDMPKMNNLTQLNAQDNYAKRLTSEQLTLTNEVAKMTTQRGYDVLAHFGWRQQAHANTSAKAILIDTQLQQRRQGVSNLIGTLRMYQGRFSHIEIDLELDRRIPTPIKERFAQHQQIAPEWLPESWRFQIKESRRIRPGQLHYIDHPLFGILVKIDTLR